ncbi:GNAT family N-acetyltransferase [Phenylobacterium aquaticum]|uniref:GNAT family N-acetyltransferase n=1 Tax=Phenylobacterium aquaticum TaxID=1763816 RepID=UPI001F5C4D07|nr:GNAT family N-acetyltransferase [Phenylobacterium aquaticum]MCI3133485.1 GNAT family N-acetyltransferase [Phenylobacterium aquaticum]
MAEARVFRPVSVDDLDVICRHRREMFQASGRSAADLAPMDEAFRPWLAPRLAAGDYFGWIVDQADGTPIAGLGMMVIDWPPHPSHPRQGARGYVLNVFVEPEHRGQGLARQLMDRAVEEGRRRELDYMILHATRMGRPLYERMGWAQTSEMSLSLRG